MAQQANIVGKVALLEGQVFARSSDGSQRQLKLGDPVYEGEVIITMEGGKVELAFDQGLTYLLRGKETLTLDSSVFDSEIPDAKNAALLPRVGELAEISRAIAEGSSLDQLLEETAAGLTGSGAADDGHNFVQLLRIAEAIPPLSYEFGSAERGYIPPLQGGQGLDSVQNAATTTIPLSATPPVLVTTPPPTPIITHVGDGSVNSVTVPEGTVAVFTVNLSVAPFTDTTFALNLSDGTATLGADFTSTLAFSDGVSFDSISGLVTVPTGVTSFTVTVPTIDDTTHENNENFTLSVGGVIGTGTIIDNDAPPAFSVNDITIDEAAGTATFTVTRSGDTTLASTVDYATASDTATSGLDFTPATGTLSFAAGVGAMTMTIPVTINNDGTFEGSEQFFVNLSNATNATIADAQGVATIVDDGRTLPGGGTANDDRPVFTIGSDVIIDEAAGTATFTVTKSGSTDLSSSVDFATANGTATAGSDYAATSGTLTFAAGETSKMVTVTINNDAIYEISEDFSIAISNPVNAVLGATTSVTGTIVDDGRTLPGGGTANDDRPGFSINDLVIDEAAGTAVFTVTRAGDLSQTASVSYASTDGSASGADYSVAPGSLSFAAGVATQTITVNITNDAVFEGAETFNIQLASPVGAVIVDGLAIGTIVDDGRTLPGGGTANDDRPVFNMGTDFVVNEAAGTVTFTVTKSGSTDLPSTVAFTTVDGTAVAGNDYDATSGTLTFAAGETSKSITVNVTNDAVFEGAQDFSVVISAPTNAILGDATQVATIVDDGRTLPGGGTANDDRPVFTIGSDVIIDEAAGTATFTVTKSGSTDLSSSVDFATANGTATAGSDYAATSGTLTFAAGETSKMVTVTINNDAIYEISEDFSIAISNPVNAVLGATTSVTGTIVDDGRTLPGGGTANDDRPGFSINDLVIDEAAGTAVFTVTRAGDLSQTASVSYASTDGSASGADYSVAPGSLSFAAGVATQTITVNITNDAVFEGAETFNIQLASPVGAVIVDGLAIGTIVDDGRTLPGGGTANDDRPVFNMGTDFVVNEAAGTVTFTVTKSGSTDLPSTVVFTTVDGTAVAGNDYDATSGTLTFAAGETSKSITVNVTNDAVFEGAQDFSVVISAPTNAILGDATQVATIVDDGRTLPGGGTANDDRPVFTIGSDVIIDEAAGTATFTVTKSGSTDLSSSVDFATANGTATAGSDYAATSGTLTFAAGETSKMVTVTINNDAIYEISEDFSIAISNPVNAVLGATTSVTGTIVDDGRTLPGGGTANDDRPGFSINDLVIDEAAGTAVFTVTRAGDLSQTASVSYASTDGSASGADYSVAPGSLSFAAGVATQTITVNITNDAVFEGAETFNIQLASPVGAVIVDGLAIGTIVDDGRTLPGGGTANDDRPVFNMGTDFVVNEAAGTVTFTVTKSGSTDLPSTVAFTTVDGTAVAGNDYDATSGTLTFAAGETSKSITVNVTNDAVFEGAQDFSVVISAPTNAILGDATQVATIVDDGRTLPGGGTANDDRPVFTIGSDVIIDEAAGTATFTVTKSGSTDLSSSVDFATANGTATAGSDYAATSGTLTFAAGETSKMVTVTINNDAIYEISEDFSIAISNPVNAVLGATTSVTGTIVDDGRTLPGGGTANDDRPGFSINDLVIDEAAGTAVFTVTRAGDLSQTASVSYASTDGSASGADYSVAPGSLSFAAGVATQTITVNITNDAVFEGAETFNIQLASPVGAVIVDGLAIGTIVDDGRTLPGGGTANDDRPVFNMGTDFVVNEAAGTVTFTVTKSGSTDLPSTVAFTTVDGTAVAGNDYDATSGTLTFAAGETSKSITVNVTNDAVFEGAQDFSVVISAPTNAILGDATQVATIVDDGRTLPGGGTANDDRPVFTIGSDVIIDEAAGTATFTVTKSGSTDLSSSVDFATANGTATAGSDYAATSGTLTFAAGETSKMVTVTINNDAIYEISEDFSIAISNPVNAVLGATTSVTGTIVDDGRTLPGGGTANDDRPGFSINDLVIDEAAGTAVFTVTRAGDLSQTASVSYASTDGSASGADYSVAPGSLSFAAGVATQTITVNITNDAVFEGAETFNIQLASPVGAVIVDGLAIGTIVDDGRTLPGGGTANDDRPVFNMGTDFVVNEAAGTVTFTVTKSGSTDLPSTVAFTTVDGTAVAGNDYDATSGTLTFAAGETSKSITVNVTNDAVFEGAQDFSVVISAPTNAILGDATQVATIVDDGRTLPGGGTANDDRPVFTIGSDVIIDEAAGTATFTVTKSGSTDLSSSVDFATANGTATAGSDYAATSGTLTFAAGETSKMVTVTINNDAIYEISEDFSIAISNPVNAVLGATTSVTGTIVDNDTAPTVSSITSPTVAEGGDLVYTVNLTNGSSTVTTFPYTLGSGTAATTDYGTPSFSNGVTLSGSTLSIPAGVTSFTVTLPTINDVLDEATETVPLTIGTVTGIGNITDNDPAPSLAINDVTVNEAAGTATFTVTLSAASGQTVTVGYNTSNGTATSALDYTAIVSGTLSFAAGVTSQTITVPIINDTLFEGNETFNVNLLNPTNATIADNLGVGTIVDNDTAPTVSSITSPTVAEGGDLVYTVNLTNGSSTVTTFPYTLGSGTAATTDYGTPSFSNGVTLSGSTLSIPAGVTSFTVTLPTINDVLDEATETVPLTIGTVTGIGNITDNDPAPSLAINDVTVNEAAGTATFTVTLSAASGQTVTVGYNTSNGTATSALDYTAIVSGTLSFAAGVTSQTITVPIINDTLFEGNETFNVNLLNPTNATIADNLGVGTIVDNDTAPTVSSITSPTVAEGGDLVYTVNLTNGSSTVTTFPYTLGSGTAATTDYGTPSFSNGVTLSGSTLSIPAGVTSFTVTLPTINDVLDEATETVPLTIGTVTGIGNITDNDPAPSLAINDVTVNEAAGTATFTVTLSAASGQTVTVGYNTSNGTATSALDYTAIVSGTLSFAAGVTSQTITVPIINDTLFEGNETFNVNLLNPTNATIADNLGVGTIVDNDTAPTVSSITSPTVAEGGDLVYTVNLTNGSSTVTTFPYTLGSGTAATTDYGTPSFSNGVTLSGSTLSIPAGVTSFTVTLPTINDVLDEATETVPLTIGTVTGIGNITDNDPAPSLAINDVTVNEAAGTATFTVTLSAASGQTVTVGYNTSNGTATSALDYTA